jgi:hypothetical protein
MTATRSDAVANDMRADAGNGNGARGTGQDAGSAQPDPNWCAVYLSYST